MKDPLKILNQSWGYPAFRPLQEEIIHSVLSGKDTLAIMPTGGGKSICYQVPALAKEGLCLVVSPLIALMKDQVENLRKKNITAFAVYAGMSHGEVINTFKVAANSNCKFLYVSPERLETNLFKEYLPAFDINLIAVDEAHCISQWGYDFRPSYLRIVALRDELPGVPVLALTASATEEVQRDIYDKLQFSKENIFRQSFERPNLSYSVFRVDAKVNKLVEILTRVPGSSIVYCKSRRRTQEISELLLMHQISSDYYHAGLAQEERNRKQEEWINNRIRVIVCTNAFGMGIDKPDVRTVIHADVPDCLENYYQEAGRAGREGKKSYAVLLYNSSDASELGNIASTRFPSEEEIKNVYQAIANYLQLPAGSGEGIYHDFDITDFTRKFKLNSLIVVYALKALEQEGWLAFNEQVFLPSAIRFTTNKSYLYEFEKMYPLLEPLIKTVLRAYEGIFNFPVNISELTVARLLKKEAGLVKQDLEQLHQHGVIEYRAQKDTPQILFLKNRIATGELKINIKAYQQRKEKFILRVNQIQNYLSEKKECRSRFIGLYFGDTQMKDCGICDNCLQKKQGGITKEEFDKIHHLLKNLLENQRVHSSNLQDYLHGIKKENAWKVIDMLQAENKLELDKGGWLKLK
jgi:ATP-dependent DNA helicase RecQ